MSSPVVDPNKLLPILKCRPSDLAQYAMVVGDPKRVHDAAALMTDAVKVGDYREYLTVTGCYNGQRISVSSHGVGAGGANVCFMELLRAGVHTLIRAGTCGGMSPSISDGDLIVATGAIREDAATEQLVPLAYPAIADREIVGALEAAAVRHGKQPHIGLVVSGANFYSTPFFDVPHRKYIGRGALAIEMELAGLLVLAATHGARAGGVFTSDGNVVSEAVDDHYDPHRDVVEQGKQTMLRVALETLAALAQSD